MVNDLTLSLFGEQALNKQMSFKDTLTLLQELDLINIGELAEKAIAKKVGVAQMARCNMSHDLENGWEIKHGQSHLQASGTQRKAYIAGMENKFCTLRVVITELLTGKLYFFKIPYEAYSDYSTSSLSWAFNLDGSPQREFLRPGKSSRPNFWKFEVTSFDELCS